jgi:hypothetical protein
MLDSAHVSLFDQIPIEAVDSPSSLFCIRKQVFSIDLNTQCGLHIFIQNVPRTKPDLNVNLSLSDVSLIWKIESAK